MEKLRYIDTSKEAESAAKMIAKKRTYLLNGPWGIGKSAFLDSFSEETWVMGVLYRNLIFRFRWMRRVASWISFNKVKRFENSVSWYLTKRLVYIRLWELKDKRPVAELTYKAIHPFLYGTTRFMIVTGVVISILNTNTVNIGLTKMQFFQAFPGEIWTFIGVVSLFISVFQLFKTGSNEIYSALLMMDLKFFSRKILVIDDFDRVDEQTQKSMYRVFNILSNKMPIIFIADIQQIVGAKNDFVSKIIQQQIEVPYSLYPINIWNNFLIIYMRV